MITTMDTKAVDVAIKDSFDEKISIEMKSSSKAEEITIYTEPVHFMEQMISALANYDEELLIKTLSDYANLEVK